MNRIAAILALAVVLAPRPSHAQASTSKTAPQASQPAQPPAAAKPADPATAGAAKDLARTMTPEPAWNEMMDAYATALSGQISTALASSGKEVPTDLNAKVRAELASAVKWEQAVDLQAQALGSRFSADELRSIGKFYGTPEGKKLLRELPIVSRQVTDQLQERFSAQVPQIIQRVAPALASTPEGGAAGEGTKPDAGSKPSEAQGRKPPPSGQKR